MAGIWPIAFPGWAKLGLASGVLWLVPVLKKDMRDEREKLGHASGQRARRPSLFPRPPARPSRAEWARPELDEEEKTHLMPERAPTPLPPMGPPLASAAASPTTHAPVPYPAQMHRAPACSDASYAPLVMANPTMVLAAQSGGEVPWLGIGAAVMAVSVAAVIAVMHFTETSVAERGRDHVRAAGARPTAPASFARVAAVPLPAAPRNVTAPPSVAPPPAEVPVESIELPDSVTTAAAAASSRMAGTSSPRLTPKRSHVAPQAAANSDANARDSTPLPAPVRAAGTTRASVAPPRPSSAPTTRPEANEDTESAIVKQAKGELDDSLGGSR